VNGGGGPSRLRSHLGLVYHAASRRVGRGGMLLRTRFYKTLGSKLAPGKKFNESSIIHPSTLVFCRTFTMIRQSFLRQRRCLIPHLPSRSISQLHSPFRSRHLDPLSSPSAKPLSLRLERRWVSTEAEAKTNPDPESFSTRGEASSQQTQAEDPLKKELETKNREIIDLKACHT
jgi:hypothetical protein